MHVTRPPVYTHLTKTTTPHDNHHRHRPFARPMMAMRLSSILAARSEAEFAAREDVEWKRQGGIGVAAQAGVFRKHACIGRG